MTTKEQMIESLELNLATKGVQELGKGIVTPQELFFAVKRAIRAEGENLRSQLTNCKGVIRALIDNEVIFYDRSTKNYLVFEPKIKSILDKVRPAGQGMYHLRNREDGTIHANAGAILAGRTFHVNVENCKQAVRALREGLVMIGGEWETVTNETKERQKAQVRFMRDLSKANEKFPTGFSFNVFADWRGRYYYDAGTISPQAGSLARFCYDEGLTTLDHRSSFAQIETMILGLKRLGVMCGVGTAEDVDFYTEVGKRAGYNELTPEQRKAVKYSTMPKAYGAGEKVTLRNFMDYWADENAYKATQAQTCVLDIIRKACYRHAELLAKEGKQTTWQTPSGFQVKQNYWELRKISWTSHEETEEVMPASITFWERTKKVAMNADENTELDGAFGEEQGDTMMQTNAGVAMCANLIQSLDASLLALTVLNYFEATGDIPLTVHNSYTVENPEALRKAVTEAYIQMNKSEELATIRKLIGVGKPLNTEGMEFNLMEVE